MGKIDKISPETLRELASQLNVSDKDIISLKAGRCELELKIILSDFNIQMTLANITPNLNDNGSNVLEATKMLQDHEGIIAKLNDLQNDFLSALDSSNENIFEWRKLLNSAFTDVKEKLEQKKIKLIRRIGTDYNEGLSDDNSAPKIIKPFKDKVQKFGLPCTFEAEILAEPAPTISWLFNDENLKIDSTSISTSQSGTTYKINISNVGPDHLGKYTLVARNPSGEVTCSAFLDHVSNHPTPRSFLSPATTNYSSLGSDEKRESLSSLEYPGTNRIKSIPRFVSRLRPMEAHEGDSVRFEVRVVCNPEPEVRWFREGIEILNSPDFKISKDDSFLDLHFLEIPEIFKEDAGRFTCMIQNYLGSDQCTANLTVHASSDFTSLSGHGSDMSLEDLKVFLPSPLHGSLSGSFTNMVLIQTSTPPTTGTAEQCVAPYFRAISKDLEVGEGKGARFDAIVAGKPNPDVTWVKDGQRISSSRNYAVVVNEKGVNSLIIQSATMRDAGTYQCIASNRVGEDWFKVTLTVLPAWSSGRYSPTNSMNPVSRASPLTVGKSVSSIARTFHSEERTSYRSLQSRMFHSEERRAMRKNFYKTASPSKSPSTEAITSVRSTARRSHRGPMFYNKNITYTSNTCGAPQLIEPIAEPEVKEGETAEMTCRISCTGPCNYVWFFNNQPLPNNPEKYEIEVRRDQYILRIKSISKSDRGFYQCTVSNDDGEVTCIGRLNPGTQLCRLARSPIPSGSRSPAPSPFTTRHVDEVRLSCTVVGDPKPNLTWYVDGRPIDSLMSDFTIYHDESTGLAELTIHDVTKYINSTVKCVAENYQGRAETECLLTESMLCDPIITDANYTNILIHQITKEQNISTIKTGPRFSQRVQPCTVEEGQTINLTAVVHGRPRPIVTWVKDDGKELHPSDKYSIVFDERKNICKLVIRNCTTEDTGEYSCIAYNPTGQTTCSTTIYISPPKDSKTVYLSKIETKKPTFHTTLQPKTETTIGEPVKFQCKLFRESTTNITWYFNGVEISSGHNMKEVDGDIVSTLIIPDPKPANTGEYTCKARNLTGESRTTSYLFVKDISSIRTSSSPQPKFCMPILQTHSEAAPTDQDINRYNKPPTFSLPLVNRVTTEGSEIFFVVRFDGEPLPSIQWFANGNPVTEKTSDCKILTDFNKKESILYIKEVFVGDEGEYTCKAENISGVAYSTSHLYIKVPTAYEDDNSTIYESKKIIDITGKPRFEVELTLIPDYTSSGRHSVTKHLFVDKTDKYPITSEVYEVDRTSEIQKIGDDYVDQSDRPFSETISIDRSDQSVRTLEFEVIPQKSEIFVQNFKADSRTSITSELETELTRIPMFSETVSIDSRDSVRQVIPISSPPEVLSQEDSEVRRLTVESEYELSPEPVFSETVAIDTSEVQEVIFEALPANQTSEITVHQEASLKGVKMEAEIILVEEKPNTFSETVTIDKTESKDIILELPETNKTAEITIHQDVTLQGIKVEAEIILPDIETFSETVSVDKTEDRTHTLEFTLPKETKTSEFTIHQQGMPKGMKVEAEILPEKKLKSELIVETGHAPKFLVELVPTTVMDGSPVEFKIKLVARPMPKRVTWFRNEKTCDEIVHIITDYNEETGESHLHIAEVFPEDGGYYTCVATNVHGTAKTTAFLTVAAYQYLESESESETASNLDIKVKPEEIITMELVTPNVTTSKVINKMEYYIEPVIETNKFEQSIFEYKILETNKASRDFQSSTLYVQPEIKKTFALVSPQTQHFDEEPLNKISTHFTVVQAETRHTENVFDQKPSRTTSKTFVPLTRVEHEIEESIDTIAHVDKESGTFVLDTREICVPMKDKTVSWITPKVEFVEEKIIFEHIEQPAVETAPKDEIRNEFQKSTTRKEEVLVSLSQEFHSEGEEDELFVEARESLDKVEIISSELNVKQPAKTSHFTNATFQNVILELENISMLSDKPELSSAKSATVESILTSGPKKSVALLHGASQKLDLNLDHVQNLQTSINTTFCTGTVTDYNLSHPYVSHPQPSLTRTSYSETQHQHARLFTTDVKMSQCQPELTTSTFTQIIDNLGPISHSYTVVEMKKPEQMNFKQELLKSSSSSISKTPSTLLHSANKTLDIKLDQIQNLQTSVNTNFCSGTTVDSNLAYSSVTHPRLSLTTTSGSEIKQHNVQSFTTDIKTSQPQSELITSTFTKLVENLKPISHSCSVVEVKKPELVNFTRESKLGGVISLPENIVAKLMRIETLETILYKSSLLDYIQLIEKELSLKTINLDNLSTIIPFPEITSIHTGLAAINGKPITRVLTNVYFIKLENVVEKDMSYKIDDACKSVMESTLKMANKEIQPLAHSLSQLHNKIAEQVIANAISQVSTLVCKPENIVTKINFAKKSEAILYRISLNDYVMLLERVLELKSLNIDSLAVILPQAELTLLQTAKAFLNENPITRAQANLYLVKLETAEEKDFKFDAFTSSSTNITNEMAKTIEEKRALSQCSSQIHCKQLEGVILDAINKITGTYNIPENVKVTTNKVRKDDKILSRVTPLEYVVMLERILVLNTLNIDRSAHNLQMPEIVLLQTNQATTSDAPLSRIQPNLFYFQFEQAYHKDMEKPVLNIQPIHISSNLAQKDKIEDTTFGVNLIYDYVMEDLFDESDYADLSSLCHKMPGKIEGPSELESCVKADKPLSKTQLILKLQEAEKTYGYSGVPVDDILIRPSMSIEPMARREKSFKNILKTFAVATLARFNNENMFELMTQQQKPVQIEKLVEEIKVKDRAQINEVIVHQKEIIETERPERTPTSKEERKPTKKEEEGEMFEEWEVETKIPAKESLFDKWEVETKIPAKESLFEEWEVETKIPAKESLFEEWTVTAIIPEKEKEETSLYEEWETTVKTEVTIEKELEQKEDDEERMSLHEEWDVTTKTELIIDEEKRKKPVTDDTYTEEMFEEWEYDTKTTYAVEKDYPIKKEPSDDELREDLYEEWETTLRTQYLMEKDVTEEIESDNESDISTQSLYEEWEFTTITRTIVEEEFPMKREVVEIRYPQKRGTNIVLGLETTSKDVSYIEERKAYERLTDTRQTLRRPIFDEEITCTKPARGHPLVLNCHIKSSSETHAEWYKDGTKIYQSPSFTIRYENGYSTLTITKLTSRYLGRYSCRAISDAGINETSITLDKNYFDFDFDEIDKDRITEEESFDEIRETWTKITDFDLSIEREKKPKEPSFELEITSVTVFDGFNATLACRVYGYPIPSIEWFLRGKKIERSPDFVMTYKDGYCSLTINEVMQHDQGQYTIRATNEYGTSETCIYLTVLDSYELRKSSIQKTWMVKTDGMHLSEDELYSSGEETMDMWTVEEWVFRDMTSQYAVEVFMKKEQSQLQLYKYVPYDEESFRLRISSTRAALLDTHPYRFPVIIKELPIIEVFEKKKAVLECVIEACPEPEVTWFKNGKIITSNEHTKITFINNVCTLTIDVVELDDEAEYKCEAKNAFGSSFTWGQIYVETVQLRWGRIKNFKIIRKKSL